MSPANWGPSTWIFLHTLAAKVKESSFPFIGQNLLLIIIKICDNLPCPECAQHSRQFWSRVKLVNIKNKTDLINVLYVFHNTVNKRKKYSPFKYDDLKIYDSKNIIETYNLFWRNFNTHGNMNLINESFHRNRMLSSLKIWMINNLTHFEL